MSHGGMTREQADIYKMTLGSYLEPVTTEQLRAIREENEGMGLFEAKKVAQKRNALAAIEACRFETGVAYNAVQHTILDVLQYLVERT